MGILNVTPDSFSDGARFRHPDEAISAALQMLEDGAHILDIGGESTRPGEYVKISDQQETDRVLPIIEAVLRVRPTAILSIDTYRASTARAALAAGAEIINDVSGFLWDPALVNLCSTLNCGVVLTHTRGRPDEWQKQPPMAQIEVLPLVLRGLADRLSAAKSSGIAASRLVLDPGFGFGKVKDENYPLLGKLHALQMLNQPLLIGVSRKNFLGRTIASFHGGHPAPARERTHVSVAAATAAILNGASIIRVHEVRSSAEAAAIADAILATDAG